MLLSLTALLIGCGTTRTVEVHTRDLPAEHLLADCPEPTAIRPKVNRDIVVHLDDWRTALRLCNADKAALRAWASDD